MFKGHPKGLYVAFFANMGERFGYYTMLAIFVLYLQARFGFSTSEAGTYYGGFLFGIYFLPILGGVIADKWLGYGKTIITGIIIMFAGYLLLALPGFIQGTGKVMIISALAVISLGTGLFKGNLQALVGKMYDDPKYSANRDNAFNIFYMGINIGAFFAPSAATAVVNAILKAKNFVYENSIPYLSNLYRDGVNGAHPFLDQMTTTMKSAFPGTLSYADKLAQYAKEMGFSGSLSDFTSQYTSTLSTSYSAGFAVAAASMILSFIIFVGFKKYYKHADISESEKAKNKDLQDQVIELSPEETKKRLIALGLVMFVVMFFWMAFHQNGFTMTIFARDYTMSKVSRFTYLFFDLKTFIPILASLGGLIFILRKNIDKKSRLIGSLIFVAGAAVTYYFYSGLDPVQKIEPQLFQHFNPIFIVFLTPIIVGFFTKLREKGKEPSSPKKIGIGMIITGIGFLILMLGSFKLQTVLSLSPYWLISTYFTLTIAELFLSPIGISFVSKVSPPKYVGLAQGGWLGATAFGNLLAGLVGKLWDIVELWQFFLLLVILTLLSAVFIFSILKILEKATK